MNFRFDISKATDAVCKFVEKEGGRINIMKLVKLIYLLDRLSVAKRGIPVVGGRYYSMRNGPVTGELLDLINAGKLEGETESKWEEFLSDRKDHEIALRGKPEYENLSPSELCLLEETYAEHGKMDQWQIRDWCHKFCAEWTPLADGRDSIEIEDLARNVGKQPEQIRRISEEAAESNLLSTVLKWA